MTVDAVVSTIPGAANFELPPACLKNKPAVLDAAYKPASTALLVQAKAAGCPVAQGASMLVACAWRSTRQWAARGTYTGDARGGLRLGVEERRGSLRRARVPRTRARSGSRAWEGAPGSCAKRHLAAGSSRNAVDRSMPSAWFLARGPTTARSRLHANEFRTTVVAPTASAARGGSACLGSACEEGRFEAARAMLETHRRASCIRVVHVRKFSILCAGRSRRPVVTAQAEFGLRNRG